MPPERIPCNLCGSDRQRRLFRKFGFTVVACADCGLHFLEAMPSDAEIAAWYDQGYFTGNAERRGYLDYVKERDVLVASFDLKLRKIEAMLPARPDRPRRLLDIGTAAGWMLQAAQARGWEGRGLEVSEYAWREAVRFGFDVVHGDSLDVFEGQRFDLITMWDVVEHLRDPRAVLTRARDLLADDGLLVFSTGDVDNFWSRLQGKRNRIYNPPQHLYYFSRRTMTAMAAVAGLGVVRVEADEKVTTLHYVLHIARNLVDIKPVAWAVGHVMPLVPNRTLRMRLSDNLVVYTRRADAPAARGGAQPSAGEVAVSAPTAP